MKKYAIIVGLCACVHLFAESNPFNLQDNLEKIDKDQDALLYALQKLSKKSKKKEIESSANIIESTIEQVPEPKQADNKENEKASLLKIDDKETEVEKQRARRLSEEEQLKKDLEKRENKKAKVKVEREKREEEAYEAKRVEKEEKKRLKIKKDTADVNINMDKEARIKKKNMDEEYLKAIAEVR